MNITGLRVLLHLPAHIRAHVCVCTERANMCVQMFVSASFCARGPSFVFKAQLLDEMYDEQKLAA